MFENKRYRTLRRRWKEFWYGKWHNVVIHYDLGSVQVGKSLYTFQGVQDHAMGLWCTPKCYTARMTSHSIRMKHRIRSKYVWYSPNAGIVNERDLFPMITYKPKERT